MTFRPKPQDQIQMEGKEYTFTEHPSAPNMAYGQTGRRATVYQLQASDNSLHALKVFTVAWRDPRNATSAEQLQAFASLPGLQVCDRHVITPQSHSGLLKAYPDLEYAVLMAWVSGETWQEVIMNGRPFSPEQSQAVARSFVEVLARMENDGLAHCDLSGPNVLIKLSPAKVELVDVEDLFGPGLVRPQKVGGGSSGYAHKTAPAGLWDAKADRFAGAVLLTEMLGWCDERVRRIAYGEQFFDPDEVQHGTERYQVLHQVLKEHWGADVAGAFAKAWYSETLDECPPFQEWRLLLNTTDEQRIIYGKVVHAKSLISQGQFDEAIKELEEAYKTDRLIVFSTFMDALVKRGDRNFREGKLEDALKDYRAAQEIAPQGQASQLIDQCIHKVQDAIISSELKITEDMIAHGQLEPALMKLKELYSTAPALAADPYAKALLACGLIKQSKGDLSGAERDYLTALSIAPCEGIKSELIKALENLKLQVGIQKVEAGENLLAEDQLDQAVLILEEAYKTVPSQAAGAYARALFTWGAQKEREGNRESALQDYRKAFQVAPEGGLKEEIKLSIDELGEKKPPVPPPVDKKKKSGAMNYILFGGIILLIFLFIFLKSCGLLITPPVVETATTTSTTKKATQPLQNTATPVALYESFELLAADGWTNTGYSLSQGDILNIQYLSGVWKPWGLENPSFDAKGYNTGPLSDSANVVQNCPHAALIGRIGNQTPFCIVGEKKNLFLSEGGELYLSINDNALGDNSGSITVKIEVQSQSTGSSTQSTDVAPTPTKIAVKQTYKILVAGDTGVFIIQVPSGDIIATLSTDQARSAELLPNGNALIVDNSIRELTLDGAEVRKLPLPYNEIYHALPYGEDGFWISAPIEGGNKPGIVSLLDWNGNTITSSAIFHYPLQTRILSNGDILVADGTGSLTELSSSGTVIKNYGLSQWATSLAISEDGSIFYGRPDGYSHMSTSSLEISTIIDERIDSIEYLPWGNLLVSSWAGNFIKEVTLEGVLVWSIDFDGANNIRYIN